MNVHSTDRICVKVFAKISAAISHEIKNTLAIINENAGLLEDLCLLSEESGGVPCAKVRAVTETIAQQVDRSNTIMKNLNRFAHSADTCPAHGDLKETLSLVDALTSRQAGMKNIKTNIDCPSGIALFTDLISFESLIYLVLLSLIQQSVTGGELTVQVQTDAPQLGIVFALAVKEKADGGLSHDEELQSLARLLHASCLWEEDRFVLSFPAGLG